MGCKNDLGSILVADFVFVYTVGSVFESLVVGLFAVDAFKTAQNNLFVVDELGF